MIGQRMIPFEKISFAASTVAKSERLISEVGEFRKLGSIPAVSLVKLEEHFKASHIYHSAGIEGNQLTLQETLVVLKEGITISEKPIRDSVEVINLGAAYHFLVELIKVNTPLTAMDLRSLHGLIIGNDPSLAPGDYRKSGVIISGAAHRPPEAMAVPALVDELIQWVNANQGQNAFLVSAIAHHELTKIHPFLDGNGRIARLFLILVLMKQQLPICNFRRDQRPHYYSALAEVDGGNFDSLCGMVLDNCEILFSEYQRIR